MNAVIDIIANDCLVVAIGDIKYKPTLYTRKRRFLCLKRMAFILFLFFPPSWILLAQDSLDVMLYPDFRQGIVHFKDGRQVSTLLNYNTEVEEMLYKNGESIWAIANPQEIVMIDIQGEKFVYFKRKVFYQIVNVGQGTLYIEWKSTTVSHGKAAGYGGYSSTAAITSYSSIREGGTITKLAPNEKFSIKPDNRYWIKNKKGKYTNVTTLSLIQKNFPKKEIKAFCTQHNLDYTKLSDMMQIMTYCFQ